MPNETLPIGSIVFGNSCSPRRDPALEAAHVGARIACVASTPDTGNASTPAVEQPVSTTTPFVRYVEEHILTPTERRVLSILAEGRCDKEIAKRIGCATGTVKSHMRNAMDKTGARSRLHLVVLALRAGVLRLEDIAC